MVPACTSPARRPAGAASAAEQRARDNAEADELQAFRNLVAAQTDKSSTEEEATMLTDLAGYL